MRSETKRGEPGGTKEKRTIWWFVWQFADNRRGFWIATDKLEL